MDKNAIAKRMKTVNTLLIIGAVCSGIAGLGMILVSIFGGEEGNVSLNQGLFYVVLGSLFNIIRMQLNKKYKNDDDASQNGDK